MAAPNCFAKKADKCLYQNSAAVGNREEFQQRAAFAQVQQLACTVWFCLWKLNSPHPELGYTAALQMSQNESLGQSSFTKTEQNLQ